MLHQQPQAADVALFKPPNRGPSLEIIHVVLRLLCLLIRVLRILSLNEGFGWESGKWGAIRAPTSGLELSFDRAFSGVADKLALREKDNDEKGDAQQHRCS